VSWCATKDYETCGGIVFHKVLDALINKGGFGTTDRWTVTSNLDESIVIHYNHHGKWYYLGLSLCP
jgi:hypothetical protein